VSIMRGLELPCVVVTDRFDSPGELLPKRLGEEFLDGNVELVGKDNSETRVDVVLH